MSKYICVKGLLNRCNRECKLDIVSTAPNQCPDLNAHNQGLVPIWVNDSCKHCSIIEELKDK